MTEFQFTEKQKKIYDYQMKLDREMMEDAIDCIVFRPAIEGEFELDEVIAGNQGIFSFKPERQMPGGDWVAVVDVGRLCMNEKEASGLRLRVPCPPPLTGEIREMIRDRILHAIKASVGDPRKTWHTTVPTKDGFKDIKMKVRKRSHGFGK